MGASSFSCLGMALNIFKPQLAVPVPILMIGPPIGWIFFPNLPTYLPNSIHIKMIYHFGAFLLFHIPIFKGTQLEVLQVFEEPMYQQEKAQTVHPGDVT